MCSVSQIKAQQLIPYAQSVVDTLTSSAYAGRGYLDDADGKAAAYIARQFEKLGVSPLSASYFQEFPITVDVIPEAPLLQINDKILEPGIDYLPFPGSAGGRADIQRQIVYAGSGIFQPNLGINDFDGLSLKDALLVLDEAIPDSIRKHEQTDPTLLTASTRVEIASRLGASGVIILTENNLSQFYAPLNTTIPAFIVSKTQWPEDVSRVSYTHHPQLDWQTTTSNVIAHIPGTASPDDYLVVMAHYDHLGRIGKAHYFPGANDNASGVALMLALASHFADHPLKQSLVFIAFSGEEQRLQGSRHFVEHPPVPLDQIKFLINLDMVASGEAGLMAVGGSDFAPEFELLSTLNDSLQLGPLGKRPNAPNSDHYFFLQQGVRGFFLYTNKGTQPYHHPHDMPATLDWGEFEDTLLLVRTFLSRLEEQLD